MKQKDMSDFFVKNYKAISLRLRSNKIAFLLLFIILLGAVFRTNYGVWQNCDVSVADEAGRLANAYIKYSNGIFSINVYNNLYFLIFRFLSDDILSAYFIMRIIAVVISVTGMFVLLMSLKWVHPVAALIASLIWNMNLLNVPIVQDYSMSLVCFGLSCWAIMLLIKFRNIIIRFVGFIITIIVGFIRPEYFVIPIVLSAYSTFKFIVCVKDRRILSNMTFIRKMIFLITMILIIGAGVSFVRKPINNYLISMDRYLFMGLGQCYSHYIQYQKPDLYPGYSWALDYKSIIQKEFGDVDSFAETVLEHPVKVICYFIANAYNNSKTTIHLFDHRSISTTLTRRDVSNFPWKEIVYMEDIVLKIIMVLSLIYLMMRIFNASKIRNSDSYEVKKQIFLLLVFAAVSLPAFVLLIPRVRYWITFVPIVYWGLAYLISNITQKLNLRGNILISIFAVFALSPSIFAYEINIRPRHNYDFVQDIRRCVSMMGLERVNVIGAYPEPFFNLAMPGKCSVESFGLNKDITFEELIDSERFNLVLIDDILRGTRRYFEEKCYITRFESHPELHSFRLILNNSGPFHANLYYRYRNN